jgi:hypothetical protein
VRVLLQLSSTPATHGPMRISSIRLLSATLEGGPRVLRVVEAIAIPPIDGNVKVIICRHPGGNVLSQYMSYVERTRSLLPGTEEDRARACHEQEPQQTRPHAKMPDAPPATPSARTPEEATGRSIDVSFDLCDHATPAKSFLSFPRFFSQSARSVLWASCTDVDDSALHCKPYSVSRSFMLVMGHTAT